MSQHLVRSHGMLLAGASFAALILGSGPGWTAQQTGADPGAASSATSTTSTDAGNGGTSAGAAVSVPPVSVSATPLTPGQVLQQDGTAAQGYRADTISAVGPLAGRSIMDTPFSVNVAPAELIENYQIYSSYQLYNMDPDTQPRWSDTRLNPSRVDIRGFISTNNKQDGLPMDQWRLINMEDKERVEIVTGLAGFLYGWSDPGGTVNYVEKRPTAAPIANLTVGDTGGANGFMHGDFGGPLDRDGKFGYRINIVGQDGDTAIDQQKLKRDLVSAAFDWHATDDLLVQVNGSHSDYQVMGGAPFWSAGANLTSYPSASMFDASKQWAQPWLEGYYDQNDGGGNVMWNINDIFTLRGALNDSTSLKSGSFINNTFSSATGTYSQAYGDGGRERADTLAEYSYLDAKFKTLSIAHTVTAGYSDYTSTFRLHPVSLFESIGGTNTNPTDPVLLPVAGELSYGPYRTSAYDEGKNAVVGDSIDITNQLSLLVGGNDARVIVKNYNTSGVQNGGYNKSAIVPAASLIYKPIENVSTYFTYIQGLEHGGTAPTGTTNVGQIFAPIIDDQYETGAKYKWGEALFTAALFEIDKAADYTLVNPDNTQTFVQSGLEVHRGVELDVSGKVTNDLTLWGGTTLMRSKLTQQTAALNGKRPTNVADQLAKVSAEYAIDAVPGLTLTGGLYYTGSQFADVANQQKVQPSLIADAGFRYQADIYGHPTTFSLDVFNLSNENYWVTSTSLGDPLTVSFAIHTGF